MLKKCPNCHREFDGDPDSPVREYCMECWRAWCRNNGTFERRTKSLADEIAKQLSK